MANPYSFESAPVPVSGGRGLGVSGVGSLAPSFLQSLPELHVTLGGGIAHPSSVPHGGRGGWVLGLSPITTAGEGTDDASGPGAPAFGASPLVFMNVRALGLPRVSVQ